MAKLNRSIIGEYQTKSLSERVSESLNGVDINYEGYSRFDENAVIDKYGTEANINRVLLWFSSKKGDYVRESGKGGVLYELLGKINSTTNLESWEDTIRSRFNAEFSNDLDIVLIKLSTDRQYRKLYINMIVRDKVENRTFTVSTEAKA